MNRKRLRDSLNQIGDRLSRSDKALLQARLCGLVSVFPFNEYEYIITFLVDRKILSFAEYEALRENYVSTNRYLKLFELGPRIFGQKWGEDHLLSLSQDFRKPDKELDPDFNGQYDLWLDGIRVEVKAARAVNSKLSGTPLAEKALEWESSAPFWLNYQQLKLDICDVFIFIGVWVDRIVYWVMANDEIRTNNLLSPQHRGGIEYQIGIRHHNIADFDVYSTEASDISAAIKQKYRTRIG